MDQGRDRQQTGIHSHDDVTPEAGGEYPGVEFADPANQRYPLDTARHIHAAWNDVQHKEQRGHYKRDEAEAIKARILDAAKKHGIQIGVDS